METRDRGGVTEFAERIKVPINTIYNYRIVASRWPIPRRRGIGFSVANTFQALDDRFELAKAKTWTRAEARAKVHERRAVSERMARRN